MKKANSKQQTAVSRRGLGLVVAALLGLGGVAHGATANGTLITNTATITMWSGPIDQIGYELTYVAEATIRVITPVTSLLKYADRGTASSGATVTFYICINNERMTADGSVWNVVIIDRMPNGMGFISANLDNYGTGIAAGSPMYGGALGTINTTYTAGTNPPVGQIAPLYMRWKMDMVGPMKSACVTFRATVL